MRSKDEMKLRELEAGRNPFRVPEGYFEDFNERLAARLPQKEQKAKTIRLMPRVWRYAAAIVVILGVSLALFLNHDRQKNIVVAETTQEEYYNEALDYIMVGNMEIAEYLTEAE